ncbi:MAG TPA: CPBP family intramembrane glutamic endopeptidase [Fimbriiglobus sp.]
MDGWVRILAVPLLLLAGRFVRGRVGQFDPPVSVERSPRCANLTLAVVAWGVLTPAVFGVNLLSNWVVTRTGGVPDTHPLVSIGSTDRTIDVFVFLLATCVLVPLAEEFVFRGVLIPWATRKRYGPVILLVVAGVFVASESRTPTGWRVAPVVFVGLLGLGLILLYKLSKIRSRFPIRTTTAVYSTAALFATVHTGVWPTPVPLFLLGLGLGYLVARTRSILPAVVVHGLFNAVSALLVLRGQTGG